jgi:hypothetical protein
MHVLVEDSGKEIPNLLAILRVQLGVTPIVVEPHLPAFDEVFVRLIQAVEKNQQQELAQ